MSALLGRLAARAAGSTQVVLLSVLAAPLWLAAPSIASAEVGTQAPFTRVVIDAGHGGKDEGAIGVNGILEKNLVLDVSERLAQLLQAEKLMVILTREEDRFVPLEVRTSRANDARGDLFVSIHANAAKSRKARGIETYFVSLEASDSASSLVAERENQALGSSGPAALGQDPFLALLGDMISTDHMADSNAFAKLAQAELAQIVEESSRGVKQAPFVVLMGVQMPAALIEIGFLSNKEDASSLRNKAHRQKIAEALARAVVAFGKRYDARRGLDSLSD
jgi:N-acetylmuramoyl-L-alanine amidase